MIKEIRLPEISESVEQGDVIKVLVSKGDLVEVDQPIVELETEKAVFEVPSPLRGRVSEILVKAGDTIKINQVILKLDTEAPDSVGAKEAGKAAGERQAPPAAAPGGERRPSPVKETAGTGVSVDDQRAVEAKAHPETKDDEITREAVPASPSLRRLARELGVDIGKLTGSGPAGRILAEDVKNYARQMVEEADRPDGGPGPEGRAVSKEAAGDVREPMSKIRRITAENVSRAWRDVPHVTHSDKADITELDSLRKKYSRKVEEAGGKLTMTAMLIRVAASALKVFPRFNASIDVEKQEIIYKKQYHIGVAVDTDRGLIVPVIRSVDRKNITQIAVELTDIARRARDKKLSPADMEGGTFTVSNLGGIGGTHFTPIVYASQAAVLGVSRSRTEPVYLNGRFEPRLLLPLSVSYDHRIIDGADAARFLRWIVDALEKPILLALEG